MGMLITNMIDKSRLSADGGGAWGGEGTSAWRARLVLFLGFALMAGGLAGSLVSLEYSLALLFFSSSFVVAHSPLPLSQTTLIIKYILPSYPSEFVYYGIAAVAQSGAIMLSSVTLWGAQIAGDSEYESVPFSSFALFSRVSTTHPPLPLSLSSFCCAGTTSTFSFVIPIHLPRSAPSPDSMPAFSSVSPLAVPLASVEQPPDLRLHE